MTEPLIFEISAPGRTAGAQLPGVAVDLSAIPAALRRATPPLLPEVSELQAVRHFTRLSRLNFSIDTHFYPLGSCTMKYNPRACNKLAMLPEFLGRHPLAPESHSQGLLACFYELQEILRDVTGMAGVSLTPMLGYTAREIPTNAEGDVDVEALKAAVGPQTAGIMLTNPSTFGVFERRIEEIAGIVHQAGGLLYYDGANLNAILGRVRPGDMGFDVIHMNLHKTFSTPHGGGGPGAGAVGVSKRLLPFMPIPVVGLADPGGNRESGIGNRYRWLTEKDLPQSIGRLSAFMGNAGVLLRAYIYARLLGREGMHRVAEFATLNANYLAARLREKGFDLAFPQRRASHEFIITLKRQKQSLDLTATDVAKRLLDYGYHAPTVYFPLLVPECLLIEPTETEDKQTLDAFVETLARIWDEARADIQQLKRAPHTLPVRRLDDVRAARQLDLRYTAA
jgi:glycine dehydrogenase subunit 2